MRRMLKVGNLESGVLRNNWMTCLSATTVGVEDDSKLASVQS